MNKQIIDELLNKARSYPKVEGYLRGLDKLRIDEGEDVPVTKREKAVRQADENAAKRLESQGKSMDQSTFDYILKCHSHVLGGETEDSLKTKKKQAPKANDHVFGNDPNDDRGSEYEMVEVKEPEAYKSEESDLVKSIEALLEKATYHGVGSREGKIYVQGTHKNPKAHGKVSSPQLSEARKKEIIEGSRKKALTQAEIGGLHGQADKLRTAKSIDSDDLNKNLREGYKKEAIRQTGKDYDHNAEADYERSKEIRDEHPGITAAEPGREENYKKEASLREKLSPKSIDERTTDLVRSLNVDYGPRRSGVSRGGWRQDPDAGIEREKEDKINYEKVSKEREKEDKRDRKTGIRENAEAGPRYDDLEMSLDDRTCDLVKDLTKDLTKEREKEIHSAVMAARMIKHDVPGADEMDYKPEDLARVVRTHNNIAAKRSLKRSLKSVIDTWKDDSPYITKGSTIMPLGPGGQIQDLAKDDSDDEDEDNGAE